MSGTTLWGVHHRSQLVSVTQIGFWRHMEVAGLSSTASVSSPAMIFLASFMSIFSIVIALFKDIPGVAFRHHPGLNDVALKLLGRPHVSAVIQCFSCRCSWGSAVWQSDSISKVWDPKRILGLYIFAAARLLLGVGVHCCDVWWADSDMDIVVSRRFRCGIAYACTENRSGQAFRHCWYVYACMEALLCTVSVVPFHCMWPFLGMSF